MKYKRLWLLVTAFIAKVNYTDFPGSSSSAAVEQEDLEKAKKD